MIKFEGDVCDSVKKYLYKKIFVIGLVLATIGTALFSILTGIAIVWWRFNLVFFILLVCAFFLLSLIMTICVRNEFIPKEIEIEDEYISATFLNSYQERKMEHFKHVIDYGDFYVIKFFVPDHMFGCVCQKDLIVEGTIEQFEEMFKDKIIRKIKNK